MLCSFHNHTRWSDGAASPEAMLRAAAALGFDELGFSDHLVLLPDRSKLWWSMPPEDLPRYLAALDALRERSRPQLRIGLELDWIPGQRDALAAVVRDPRLDFSIGSVHRVGELSVDEAPPQLAAEGPDCLRAFFTRYWALVRELAESGLFQVVGHLDVPRKRVPGADLCEAPGWEEALDAIAAAGLIVELNTAGWAMPCAGGFPAPRLLAACLARGIPITVSGDAHRPERLTAGFREAVALLDALGCRELAIPDRPAPRFQPLSAFARSLEEGLGSGA